jgi:hypothetical protein
MSLCFATRSRISIYTHEGPDSYMKEMKRPAAKRRGPGSWLPSSRIKLQNNAGEAGSFYRQLASVDESNLLQAEAVVLLNRRILSFAARVELEPYDPDIDRVWSNTSDDKTDLLASRSTHDISDGRLNPFVAHLKKVGVSEGERECAFHSRQRGFFAQNFDSSFSPKGVTSPIITPKNLPVQLPARVPALV